MNSEIERTAFENMVKRVSLKADLFESDYKRYKLRRERKEIFMQTAEKLLSTVSEMHPEQNVIEKRTQPVPIAVGGNEVMAQVVRTVYLDEYEIGRVTSIQVQIEGNEANYELFGVDEVMYTDLPGSANGNPPRRTRIFGQNGMADDQEVLEGMLAIRYIASQTNVNV